ncbi:hypothetical protein CW713_00400 [Methanophagales archaeon]|nr:MAG: hypothetical protein CW714_04720 [Methanophagales archaeon]RJS86317.1 MAG: hypothetical protein CW713_00400 [Methanophagales archaeon]
MTAKEELIKNGGRYQDTGVVVSGNIVTAKGPEYAREFAMAVSDVMLNRSSSRPYEMPSPEPEGFVTSFVAVAIAVVSVLFALRLRR